MHKYRPHGSSWACEEGKKDSTAQERKKVTKGLYISPVWGKAPTEAICIKNCVVGDLADVITCAKFQNEIFSYDLQRVKFSIFLLIFEWALQHCSATALPVIAANRTALTVYQQRLPTVQLSIAFLMTRYQFFRDSERLSYKYTTRNHCPVPFILK